MTAQELREQAETFRDLAAAPGRLAPGDDLKIAELQEHLADAFDVLAAAEQEIDELRRKLAIDEEQLTDRLKAWDEMRERAEQFAARLAAVRERLARADVPRSTRVDLVRAVACALALCDGKDPR